MKVMLGVTKTMFLMPDKKKTENDVFVKLTNLKQTGGLLRFVSQATKSSFVIGLLVNQQC